MTQRAKGCLTAFGATAAILAAALALGAISWSVLRPDLAPGSRQAVAAMADDPVFRAQLTGASMGEIQERPAPSGNFRFSTGKLPPNAVSRSVRPDGPTAPVMRDADRVARDAGWERTGVRCDAVTGTSVLAYRKGVVGRFSWELAVVIERRPPAATTGHLQVDDGTDTPAGSRELDTGVHRTDPGCLDDPASPGAYRPGLYPPSLEAGPCPAGLGQRVDAGTAPVDGSGPVSPAPAGTLRVDVDGPCRFSFRPDRLCAAVDSSCLPDGHPPGMTIVVARSRPEDRLVAEAWRSSPAGSDRVIPVAQHPCPDLAWIDTAEGPLTVRDVYGSGSNACRPEEDILAAARTVAALVGA